MSTVAITTDAKTALNPAPALRADSLADSIMTLLVMTVVQRVAGLARGVLFCRWLEPDQLGQWDVALGFLTLAAPLAVLGLPGSFGRYAEHYQQRGLLRMFLRRTTMTSAVMALAAVCLIAFFPGPFSRLISGTDGNNTLVVWVGVCLATVVAHNFIGAVLLSVRMYRVVTALQFFQSLGFAVVSLALIVCWQATATSVVIGYGVACLLCCIGALPWLRRIWTAATDSPLVDSQRDFWRKLAPFAVWIWVTNLLANVFEILDRYMIVHYSGMDSVEALRQVGYYHSSRIIPLLFVSVAALLGSIITPHLSHDWEAGRRASVVRRLNLMLKVAAWGFFGCSVCVLLFAPYLFEVAFRDKFAGGLAVLPWTLTYCAWFGMIAVAQNYLWCSEKARLSSIALLGALVLSVCCNLVLLPRFGLHGAVWSTTIANLAALALTYYFNHLHGMRIDGGTWLLTLSLALLGAGPLVAGLGFVLVTAAALSTDRILTTEEKQELLGTAGVYLEKLKSLIGRLRPASSGC